MSAVILSTVAIAFSALMLIFLARIEFWRPSRLPFVAYLLAWLWFLQALRAAAVRRAKISVQRD